MCRMLRYVSLCPLLASLCACAPPSYTPDTGGNETGVGDDTSACVDTSPAPDPSIQIIFPESSSTVYYCSTLMVAVHIQNFVLSAEHTGGDPVDGEGHWHLYDGADYLGQTYKEYLFVGESKALSEGEHVLVAELVQNNHQPFDDDIFYQAEILVDDTPPDDPETEAVETCLGGTAPIDTSGG